MILVGDVGGTNTRFAMADRSGAGIELRDITIYPSSTESGLEPHLRRYLRERDARPQAVALGIPGPVRGQRARLTNLTWEVDGEALAEELGVDVRLLNDLEAAAHGLLVAPQKKIDFLLPGAGPTASGGLALLVPGTGLGEALVVRGPGELIPVATEGGHADYAPRDEEEVELWRWLGKRVGHVSYERVVSGPGLVALHGFYAEMLEEEYAAGHGESPPEIVRAALGGHCSACVAAVRRFASVLGAEASNLALKGLATGGVFIGGAIAPRILPQLGGESFREAFLDKGRYRDLLAEIPVGLILDPHLGLRGAARAVLGDS